MQVAPSSSPEVHRAQIRELQRVVAILVSILQAEPHIQSDVLAATGLTAEQIAECAAKP